MMFTITIITLTLLFYTYVGYPVLVAVLARLYPLKLTRDSSYVPYVSVCIPVHNAAHYLETKLQSLRELDYPAERLEILIFSDGSTDNIKDVVDAQPKDLPTIRLLGSPVRRGKPSALNDMRLSANGDVLLLTDVRQPLSKNALRDMMAMLHDPRVGCVSGNLCLVGDSGAGVYWRYESWIRRSESSYRSMVGATGPIYALRKADLVDIPEDTILDDQWIPLRLRLLGKLLVLCDTAHATDEAFEDEREFRRKTRTLAGNFQLLSRMPRLLLPWGNPSWFEIFSHKVLRLLSPFLAVGLLVSAAFCCTSLFVAQLAFYTAAILGPLLGRLGIVARSFVMMNAAALVGFWRFVRSSQKVTW